MFTQLLLALPAGGAFPADDRYRHVTSRFSLRAGLVAINRENVDRFVDIASVVLISIAAVLSAICGYQSGRWSGHQAMYYNVANGDRIRSAEQADRANVLTAIDVALFLQYVDAINTRDAAKERFIYRRLRPEMKTALDAWLATNPRTNPKAPSSPFVMPQYSLATRAEAARLESTAGANFNQAQEANRHSDDFLLLTVIFAGVSFLGGISTKMVYPRHAILIGLGLVGIVYGAIRLVELPFL